LILKHIYYENTLLDSLFHRYVMFKGNPKLSKYRYSCVEEYRTHGCRTAPLREVQISQIMEYVYPPFVPYRGKL